MKYLFLIIAVLVLLSVNNVFSQSITWQKYFELSNSIAYRTAQTNDSGFITAGTRLIAPGNREILLIKQNISGDTTWIKYIGGEGFDNAWD